MSGRRQNPRASRPFASRRTTLFSILAAALLALPARAGQKAADPPDESPLTPTRKALLVEARLEKLEALEAESLHGVERAFLWVERQLEEALVLPRLDRIDAFLELPAVGMEELVLLDYKQRVIPVFGSIRRGSGLGAGVRYRTLHSPGDALDVEALAAVSIEKYVSLRTRFGHLLPRGYRPAFASSFEDEPQQYFLYGDVRYERRAREEFYGLGPRSFEESELEFGVDQAAASVVTGYRFAEHLTLGLRGGLARYDVGAPREVELAGDPQFRPAELPGFGSHHDFAEIAAALLLDLGEVPGNPHRGAFLGLTFSRFDDVGGSAFDFHRLAAEARGYLSLGSPQRVIALQALASADQEQGAGAAVPFFLQRTLGGGDRLRGFADFRFRGPKLLYFSAEYRWEAAPAFEMAVFYDAGRVFDSRSDIRLEDLEDSYGFGFRFKGPESVFFRLDFGWSDEGQRFLFTTGHPF